MYIWCKRAGARWLHVHNEIFTRVFGSSLVVIERPGEKRALLEICCKTASQARELIREFGGSAERLRRDWLQHFGTRARHKPLRVGARLTVIADNQALVRRESSRQLIIPAEAAFGTGEHATTAMCLRLLECITRPRRTGWKMFDAGTGSGILAIAGRCFGAGPVLAIDSDPLACATAKRNARANRVRNIEFVMGDVLETKLRGKFDVITANLFSEILIAALPLWSRHLASDGSLILSGILRNQESAIRDALTENALTVSKIRRRGKWIAVLAKVA